MNTIKEELFDSDMKQINELRNVVFHFKRQVTPQDIDRMNRFRDGLRFALAEYAKA